MEVSITPSLKKKIKDAGLNLTLVNDRYWTAKKRSSLRGVRPPNRKKFYQQFITKFTELKALPKYRDLSASELYHLLDVHSTEPNGGYKTFELLPRDKHKELHHELRQQKWEQVKVAGQKVCSQCQKLKPLSEFYKSKQHPSGHRPECKECHKARAAFYRELKEVAA